MHCYIFNVICTLYTIIYYIHIYTQLYNYIYNKLPFVLVMLIKIQSTNYVDFTEQYYLFQM